MQNLVFMGGIHGSGKNYIIDNFLSGLPIEHLTASSVLKWNEYCDNPNLKKVNSIMDTQNRLTSNLAQLIGPDKQYILNGHYTLLNKDGHLKRITKDTFIKISPKTLYLKISDISAIYDRLKERGGNKWSKELIKSMQKKEVIHAQYISKILKTDLHIIDDTQGDLLFHLVSKDIL